MMPRMMPHPTGSSLTRYLCEISGLLQHQNQQVQLSKRYLGVCRTTGVIEILASRETRAYVSYLEIARLESARRNQSTIRKAYMSPFSRPTSPRWRASVMTQPENDFVELPQLHSLTSMETVPKGILSQFYVGLSALLCGQRCNLWTFVGSSKTWMLFTNSFYGVFISPYAPCPQRSLVPFAQILSLFCFPLYF